MESSNNSLVTVEDYPKALIDDFQVFLDYVNQHKIKLTKTREYLARKDLRAIYPLLEKHEPAALEKGNQDQYPLIHLFFHLALSLDITRKIGANSGASLLIDANRYAVYKQLNASEQYVTLLDAFWTKVDWSDLQRDRVGKTPDNIDFIFEDLREQRFGIELIMDEHPEIEDRLYGFEHFFYYFSYFGFWQVNFREDTFDEINKIRYTKAKSITLMPLLQKIIPILLETWEPQEDDGLAAFMNLFGFETEPVEEAESEPKESLFTLLQPLFLRGELKQTLPEHSDQYIEGNFIFKVMLNPDCWRKLQLPSSATLLDLHHLIQKAFSFNDDHLYSFFMDGKMFGKPAYHAPMDSSGPYVNAIQIGRLQLYEGKRFLYLFDYGDEWHFAIDVVKIKEEKERVAAIIEEKGEAPDQYDYGW